MRTLLEMPFGKVIAIELLASVALAMVVVVIVVAVNAIRSLYDYLDNLRETKIYGE